MFEARETQLRLTHWQRSLPREVAVPHQKDPVTREALVHVIRQELLPFITYGPTYAPAVAEYLRAALQTFRAGAGDEFDYCLGKALASAISFRNVTDYEPGAVVVTATSWGVSYSTGSHIDGAILNVYDVDETAPNAHGGTGLLIRHPVHDGMQFVSIEAATRFAYYAGLLKRHTRSQ